MFDSCFRLAFLASVVSTPVDTLEKRFSTTPFEGAIGYGDIMRTADGARFHLRSAHQILSTLFSEQPAFLTALDDLLRLEFGLAAHVLLIKAARQIRLFSPELQY